MFSEECSVQQEDVPCVLPEVGVAASTGSIAMKTVHLVQGYEVRDQHAGYYDLCVCPCACMCACTCVSMCDTKDAGLINH